MQNKGFIKFFAIALGLICLFYLSFSFAARYQTNKAEKFAMTADDEIDQDLYNKYIDSISGEKVWLGYTYKEVLEKEISLGLDLKGGMNVTLEISVPDILKALSNNSTNKEFNEALELAKSRQESSQKDFLTLFDEAYNEICKRENKEARLSTIFSTPQFKNRDTDKILLETSNAQVITILKKEVDAAIGNSFNVLRSRIDRFGVVQPNIQKLENSGRILVELPGVKEKERVRKLLQGTANLEFYVTYDISDIYQGLVNANEVIRNIQDAKEENKTETTEVVETETVAVVETTEQDSTATSALDDLLAGTTAADSLTTDAESLLDEENLEIWKKANPLFSILNLSQTGGPVVGRALASDMATIDEYFAMKQVKELLPRDLELKWGVKPVELETNTGAKRSYYELIAIKITGRDGKKAPLEGNVITDARADFGQRGSNAEVSMTMNSEGAQTWARLTKENIGNCIAIVLDGYVYSYPRVSNEITGGRSQITGNFTPEEAKDLANVLKSGTMPAPAYIVQEDVVGPSLGQEAIDSGLMSFVIAFIMVMVYMIFYYGVKPGLIADFALITNLFFLMGILVAWKATLTLPGIAGIVLTMGMAIDSNVLIYERIREELKAGKNIKKAVNDGFKNAISAILDSNITTLLTGIILAWFGTGPVQGFATTLIIGILTSVFTAVFVTRIILGWLADTDRLTDVPFTSKITKNWFQNTHFDFMGKRKITYIITGVVIVIAIVSLATRNLKQGIDFSGGRNYVVRFDQPVSTVDVQESLQASFDGHSMSVITIGTNDQVRISTNYKYDDKSNTVDNEIENRLYTGLKSYLGENVTEEMFAEGYIMSGDTPQLASSNDKSTFGIQSSQKVGASIADDIKTSAIWAVIFSVIGIGLYILIRFRDISFSIGAIASLVNVTIFILGAYSLFYSIMPFSMEIDQQFIAAILTVIGYAINDTVVVFDRIREITGLYPKRDRGEVINESLNVTLSRTFSTTFSTLLVLIVIFIFGGDVIRGFIFALLIGIACGAYSTLFVASPIAYEIQRMRKGKKAVSEK